jgi:hypothetical protein
MTPAPARSFAKRLGDSAPSPACALFGSLAFAAALAIMAAVDLHDRNGFVMPQWRVVIAMFFIGGGAAFWPGLLLSNLLFCGRRRLMRILGGALVMALSAHCAIAVIFALQYRMYYAHWHAHFPSVVWAFQFSFTSASAAYQYTVLSLSIYGWPGLAIFLAFGLWFQRRSH